MSVPCSRSMSRFRPINCVVASLSNRRAMTCDIAARPNVPMNFSAPQPATPRCAACSPLGSPLRPLCAPSRLILPLPLSPLPISARIPTSEKGTHPYSCERLYFPGSCPCPSLSLALPRVCRRETTTASPAHRWRGPLRCVHQQGRLPDPGFLVQSRSLCQTQGVC